MINKDSFAVLLQEKWRSGFLPSIDGVGWPTSDVFLVNVGFESQNGRYVLERGKAAPATLADITAVREIRWQHAGPSCECTNMEGRLRAIGGEGAWGGDGFVAVVSAHTGELVWYAFFESSNPFEQVRFEGDVLVATNNLGDEFRFPLDSPASFTIHHTRPFG